MAALAAHARHASPAARASALAALALAARARANRFAKRVPGYDRRRWSPAPPWPGWPQLPVETSARGSAASRRACPTFHVPDVPPDADPGAALAGADRRDARRDRVADVGGGRRSDDRRPAQSERGAGGAGRRQHRVADVRRAAGHRRDRAHRHQHPIGRAHAGGRHDPRADAAGRAAVRRAAGAATCRWPVLAGDPVRRRLRTWASGARFRELLRQTETDIAVWVIDVCADGVRRPHGGGRGRDDPRGAALSSAASPRRRRVDRVTPRVHRGRARRTSCRTRTIPDYVHDLPHPRAVPVRRRPTSCTTSSTDIDELPPIVDPAAAQHDGDRRDRAARARGSRRCGCARRAGR